MKHLLKTLSSATCTLVMCGCVAGNTNTQNTPKGYALCEIQSLDKTIKSEPFITSGFVVRSLHFNDALESNACPGTQYLISQEYSGHLKHKWDKINYYLWKGDSNGFVYKHVKIHIKAKGHIEQAGALSVFVISKILNYRISFPNNKERGGTNFRGKLR